MKLRFAFAILSCLGLAPGALAGSCSERQQVCLAYCAKTYNNAPKCLRACNNYMGECIATGCWESKITAKQCGFTRS